MLSMLPLLVADPDLPAEVRRALTGPPEEAIRALVRMGVSCKDAIALTWRSTHLQG